MEKKWLFSILISLAMILVACGSEETAKEDNNNEESLPQSTENNGDQGEETMEAEEEDTTEDEENDAAKTAVSETEIMNPAIAEESQGDVEVIYTNTQPNYSADFDGLQVKVNAYQIVKVTDIHASQEPRFDGLEGYVVTADATIENTSDKRLRYNANMRIQLADKFDYIPSQTRYYIAEEKQLKWDRPEDISTLNQDLKRLLLNISFHK